MTDLAELTLPDLTGSEKQIAWANRIREDFLSWATLVLATIDRRLDQYREHPLVGREGLVDELEIARRALLIAVEHAVTCGAKAGYWIDSRDTVSKRGWIALAYSCLVESGRRPPQPPRSHYNGLWQAD